MERKVDIWDDKLGSMGLHWTSKVPQNKAEDLDRTRIVLEWLASHRF